MGGMRNLILKTAMLAIALLPMMAAVSPEAATAVRDSSVSVAIAQPLPAMDGAPIVAMPRLAKSNATMPESVMLLLVGSSLIGLAAIVRRTM
jgi:hypothetical protein